jgi:hypothetical protein
VAERQLAPAGRRRRGKKAAVTSAERVVLVLSQRDALMAEIAVGMRAKTPSPLIKKASALLTRFWARADWHSRAEILRTARWLLNLALIPPSPMVRIRGARKREGQVHVRQGSGKRFPGRAPLLRGTTADAAAD